MRCKHGTCVQISDDVIFFHEVPGVLVVYRVGGDETPGRLERERAVNQELVYEYVHMHSQKNATRTETQLLLVSTGSKLRLTLKLPLVSSNLRLDLRLLLVSNARLPVALSYYQYRRPYLRCRISSKACRRSLILRSATLFRRRTVSATLSQDVRTMGSRSSGSSGGAHVAVSYCGHESMAVEPGGEQIATRYRQPWCGSSKWKPSTKVSRVRSMPVSSSHSLAAAARTDSPASRSPLGKPLLPSAFSTAQKCVTSENGSPGTVSKNPMTPAPHGTSPEYLPCP